MTDDLPEEVRLLHVDDDPAFLDLVGQVLEERFGGFVVTGTSDPDEGIAALEREPTDCVISDYDMPGTNGLEFLAAVRAEHPQLPFVLFTGKGSEEIAGDAISRGVSDYLQKEPGIDQLRFLANSVENVVAKAAAEREVERTRDWFARLLTHIPDFVFVVDAAGEISYCSPSVEPIMGYPPEAIEGVNAFEFTHPEDLETATEGFARVLERSDQEITVEFRAEHADGSWRDLEVRGHNLLDDQVIEGIVVSARDVSGRVGRTVGPELSWPSRVVSSSRALAPDRTAIERRCAPRRTRSDPPAGRPGFGRRRPDRIRWITHRVSSRNVPKPTGSTRSRRLSGE